MYRKLILASLLVLFSFPALASQKYIGGSWVEVPDQKYVGGLWVEQNLYKYDGANWVLIGGSAPEPTVKCVGYENIDCAWSTKSTTSYTIGADRTYVRESWTATEDGTITAIYFKTGGLIASQLPSPAPLAVNQVYPSVYRNDAGTWNLICTGSPISPDKLWSWYRLPMDTGACTFSSGDVLRMGTSVDRITAYDMGSSGDEASPVFYNVDSVNSGSPTPITWTESVSTHDLAVMMEYQP